MNRQQKLKQLENALPKPKPVEEVVQETFAKLGLKDGEPGEKGTDGLHGVDGSPGRDGIDGVRGKDGLPGAKGKDGTPGRDGIDGHGITWLGQWKTQTSYVVNNAVFNMGSAYICITDHKSKYVTEPGTGDNWNSVWAVMAEKGETGPGGASGANGTSGGTSLVTLSATEPAPGADGLLYYNTTTSTLYICVSGVWVAVGSGTPSDRSVNKSDTITITEAATVAVVATDTPLINTSDTVTVTESVNKLVTSFVNTSDTITLSESTGVSVVDPTPLLLQEDGTYLLQETGDKVILES